MEIIEEERLLGFGNEALFQGPMHVLFSQLKALRFLVQGEHSQVFSAKLNGLSVVVKTFRPDVPLEVGTNALEKEMQILQGLQNKHIVKLIGHGTYCKNEIQRVFLVYEHLEGRTLSRKIFSERKKMRIGESSYNISKALHFGLMISQGMEFLHGHNIVHRDLKPDNLVFASSGVLKIIDFSLSISLPESHSNLSSTYHMTGKAGTVRYMAPEVFKGEPYNESVDIYSFAIILWEMLTLRQPFNGMSVEKFRQRVIEEDFRPCLKPEWPDELQKLLLKCWDKDIKRRPSFRTISEILKEMIDAHKKL